MDAPVIDLFGLPVRAPVTAATNLFLLLECMTFTGALRERRSAQPRLWSAFFVLMALGALAGIPKHGVASEAAALLREVGRYGSNLATAASGTLLLLILLRRRAIWTDHRRWLVGTALAELAGFSLITLRHPSFSLVALRSGLLLAPMMVLEARAWLRGDASSGWITLGLVLSSITGVVYGLGLELNAWIDHLDVSHVLLAGAMLLLFRGAEAREAPWTA